MYRLNIKLLHFDYLLASSLEHMNNFAPVSTLTNSTTPSSTALDLGLVLGPHSGFRCWFKTWVQPWLGIIGMVDNLVVVIIFGPVLSGWCANARGKIGMDGRAGGGSASLVSRIYYVVISVAELFNVGVGLHRSQHCHLLAIRAQLLINTFVRSHY